MSALAYDALDRAIDERDLLRGIGLFGTSDPAWTDASARARASDAWQRTGAYATCACGVLTALRRGRS